MKFRIAVLLVAWAVLMQCGFAQSLESSGTNDHTMIAIARCQYLSTDEVCVRVSKSSDAGNGPSTTAQVPRGIPGASQRPRRPWACPRPQYPPMWTSPDYGNHAALGALIGFGLGAGFGATASTDTRGRVAASLLVGSLGALLGAAVGHTIPAFHVRRHSPRGGSPEEEMASGSPDETFSWVEKTRKLRSSSARQEPISALAASY
jgi:hypothetical protein